MRHRQRRPTPQTARKRRKECSSTCRSKTVRLPPSASLGRSTRRSKPERNLLVAIEFLQQRVDNPAAAIFLLNRVRPLHLATGFALCLAIGEVSMASVVVKLVFILRVNSWHGRSRSHGQQATSTFEDTSHVLAAARIPGCLLLSTPRCVALRQTGGARPVASAVPTACCADLASILFSLTFLPDRYCQSRTSATVLRGRVCQRRRSPTPPRKHARWHAERTLHFRRSLLCSQIPLPPQSCGRVRQRRRLPTSAQGAQHADEHARWHAEHLTLRAAFAVLALVAAPFARAGWRGHDEGQIHKTDRPFPAQCTLADTSTKLSRFRFSLPSA